MLDLMMGLNSENLATLKQQFAKYRNSLTVAEFVAVMKEHLPPPADDAAEIALITNLAELFAQVDVNGDGSMEWAELTSFIVEMQMAGTVAQRLPRSVARGAAAPRRVEDAVGPTIERLHHPRPRPLRAPRASGARLFAE